MMVNPATTHEQAITAEIYPNVAAIASAYGDPDGKYVKFLNASGFAYADDATFLWDQPLAGGDSLETTSGGASGPSAPPGAGAPPGASGKQNGARSTDVVAVEHGCFLALSLILLAELL